MGVKKIDFIQKEDFQYIDNYYNACMNNVILELYCRSMFIGNTIITTDAVYYMDDCFRCALCREKCNCPYD